MRYPPEKIDEVRNATDIVELIGGSVRLKKRGKNFVGLCPFHTEKTPSFTVSPGKQMYHCFGCGVGGNVFTFVMELEKVSFPEAVRSLAERAGIVLPQSSAVSDLAPSETEALYEACSAAGRFFFRNLTETTEGKLALEYFRYRGFSDETIKAFGLGYALNSWDALIEHAESLHIPRETLEKAGLVRKRDDGTVYDYFRGRAMFPIFSTPGRVVGFGARKMREDDPLGKYINSPETQIYNKSRILYGMYQAKDAIREKDNAILVEGYADLISLYQAGIHYVVASSGTALTSEQIQLLGRYTRSITVVYDADSAGSKAALRGVDLILENDLDVRVAQLHAGEDPDSFVRKHGGAAFEDLLARSISFVDFIAHAYEEQGKLQTPEGQAEAVRAIVQTITKMKDELKRHIYVKHVAEKYKLYESVLYREMEKYLPRARLPKTAGLSTRAVPVLEPQLSEAPPFASSAIPAAERDLLHAMLEGRADVVTMIFQQVSPEEFSHPQARSLAYFVKDVWELGGGVDSARLMNEVEDEDAKRLIADLVFNKYELSKGWKKSGVEITEADTVEVARDAMTFLRRRALERRMEDNERQLKEAAGRPDDESILLSRQKQLLEEMKALTAGKMQTS